MTKISSIAGAQEGEAKLCTRNFLCVDCACKLNPNSDASGFLQF